VLPNPFCPFSTVKVLAFKATVLLQTLVFPAAQQRRSATA
jgi:hypothetical protein